MTLGFAAIAAGCSSTEVLPQDAPVAEPGYPAYTAPAAEPTSTVVALGPETETPAADPSASDAAGPTTSASRPSLLSPRPTGGATPAPSAAATAEPTSGPTGGVTGVPVEPSTPAAPSPSPVTPTPTPAALVLSTSAWVPACGATVSLPSGDPSVSLAVSDLGTIGEGSALHTSAVLANLTGTAIQAEQYYTTVTIVHAGRVVSRAPGGTDAGPVIVLAGGGSLAVPVDHDLHSDCGAAATSDAEPTTAAALASSGADQAAASTTTEALASSGEEGAEDFAPNSLTALAPGEYEAIIAVHVLRDHGVVAVTTASLTIS